jgi:hypothetical protein
VADQFDQAQRIDGLMAESALALHQKNAAKEPKLKPNGECWNPLCGEPLVGAALFCGPSCAQEHARRSK